MGPKIKTIGEYNIHVNEEGTGYLVHNYINDVIELEAQELPKCFIYAKQANNILEEVYNETSH